MIVLMPVMYLALLLPGQSNAIIGILVMMSNLAHHFLLSQKIMEILEA